MIRKSRLKSDLLRFGEILSADGVFYSAEQGDKNNNYRHLNCKKRNDKERQNGHMEKFVCPWYRNIISAYHRKEPLYLAAKSWAVWNYLGKIFTHIKQPSFQVCFVLECLYNTPYKLNRILRSVKNRLENNLFFLIYNQVQENNIVVYLHFIYTIIP